MPIYMADRTLPGITLNELTDAQQAAIRVSQQFSANGKPVLYISTIFVPGESRCLCLFEAATAKVVQEVNELAGFPFTRIVHVMNLSPSSVPLNLPS